MGAEKKRKNKFYNKKEEGRKNVDALYYVTARLELRETQREKTVYSALDSNSTRIQSVRKERKRKNEQKAEATRI